MTQQRRKDMENWWHYNWLKVVVAAVALALAGNLVFSSVTSLKSDLQVCIVSSTPLPDEALKALSSQLEPMTEDWNGDGKVSVEVVQYTVNFHADGTTDSARQKAGVSGMLANLRAGYSQVFLLDDPDNFSLSTGALRYLDGTLPQDGVYPAKEETCYRWADCPVLAGLELGSYNAELYGGTGQMQDLFSGLYIGSRGFWDDTHTEHPEADEALWQALTKGAVPMA